MGDGEAAWGPLPGHFIDLCAQRETHSLTSTPRHTEPQTHMQTYIHVCFLGPRKTRHK